MFRAATGIKLSSYINERRLEYAKRLLKKTNMNISEIAYSCGYTDPGYFTRIFRKKEWQKPSRYREFLFP